MPTGLLATKTVSAKPPLVWWLLFLACPLFLVLSGLEIVDLFNWASQKSDIEDGQLMQRLFLVVAPIFVFGLTAAIVAVRYVYYSSEASFHNQIAGLQNRQHYHQDLMRLIADHRPGKTLIIDGEDRLWFINSHAAKSVALPAGDIVGRPFEKTFPESDVLRILPLLQHVRQTGEPIDTISKVKEDGQTRFIKLHAVPMPSISNMINATMISEEDVTSLLVEREARERMFRQVIDTLVAVVDRRDPFAAGHSVRVGQIARAVAEQLQLDAVQVETAEIAGLLMNFGKVLVPRAILTKTTALSPDELKQVRESLLTSSDILALIGFSQPVVPTLRQVMERYDGSGIPSGLKGDAILITARIVTVANAFVALVSARAHRPSMSIRVAIEALQQSAGRAYDGHVVAALTNAIALRDHKIEWLAGQ
ncbi:MAG: HD domain-containing phosphohydrolase [Alphaproteobacteria bacterium]